MVVPQEPTSGEGAMKSHLDLALRYLREGRGLMEKDPIQASEKLYKAAEEAVKGLSIHFNLLDVLSSVERRGRWTVTELEKAVLRISERLGGWFGEAWDRAWALHVWGLHEGRFDAEDVGARVDYVERMVEGARRVVAP
jgi:hypothetical protein